MAYTPNPRRYNNGSIELSVGKGCVSHNKRFNWKRGSLVRSFGVGFKTNSGSGFPNYIGVELVTNIGSGARVEIALNVCYQTMYGVTARPIRNNCDAPSCSELQKERLPQMPVNAIDVDLRRPEPNRMTL